MKKIVVIILILGALAILSGCTEKNKGPYVEINDPPTYVYGLLEECSDSIHYCTLKSIEITSSYVPEESAQDGGSGYYVIIGADTNLSENDMSDSENEVELVLEWNDRIELKFVKRDAENGKLIYEIPYIESLDYLQLCNLKVSNKILNANEPEVPALCVRLSHYDNCTTVGSAYGSRYFWLELE